MFNIIFSVTHCCQTIRKTTIGMKSLILFFQYHKKTCILRRVRVCGCVSVFCCFHAFSFLRLIETFWLSLCWNDLSAFQLIFQTIALYRTYVYWCFLLPLLSISRLLILDKKHFWFVPLLNAALLPFQWPEGKWWLCFLIAGCDFLLLLIFVLWLIQFILFFK